MMFNMVNELLSTSLGEISLFWMIVYITSWFLVYLRHPPLALPDHPPWMKVCTPLQPGSSSVSSDWIEKMALQHCCVLVMSPMSKTAISSRISLLHGPCISGLSHTVPSFCSQFLLCSCHQTVCLRAGRWVHALASRGEEKWLLEIGKFYLVGIFWDDHIFCFCLKRFCFKPVSLAWLIVTFLVFPAALVWLIWALYIKPLSLYSPVLEIIKVNFSDVSVFLHRLPYERDRG